MSDIVLVQSGRSFNEKDIAYIKRIIDSFRNLPRTELANTICEHLAWFTPSGGLKERAAIALLEKLEPVGCVIRYFICANQRLLGAICLSGASRAIAARDQWIGGSPKAHFARLPFILNNTRFLIFPWVKVPHLASHALGKLAKQIGKDFAMHFGFQPLLLETFVDPIHFQGICYKAANWLYLGKTSGRGLGYQTTPKMVWVYPLHQKARQALMEIPHG